jgi:hypothetical protein
VRKDLPEDGLQPAGVQSIRRKQDLVRGGERGFALENAGFLPVFGFH